MIAASVVTYNTDRAELLKCIGSLSSQIFDAIYVIDNSSAGYIRDLCGGFPNVEYIPHPNNGYGAAHNVALRESIAAGRAYHLVLNPDVYFQPESINTLIGYMESNHDIGALQPKILNTDGTMQYTVRMLPSPFDLFIRRFVPSGWYSERRHKYELRDVDHEKAFNVPYHQGSFMLLRCEALDDAGFFDERFFMYPEDIDLTRRIHRRWRTMYVPFVTVVHAHRAESYKNLRMTKIHISNMIRYFNKWGWFFDRERRQFNRAIRTQDL